jgi:hypothetical protein
MAYLRLLAHWVTNRQTFLPNVFLFRGLRVRLRTKPGTLTRARSGPALLDRNARAAILRQALPPGRRLTNQTRLACAVHCARHMIWWKSRIAISACQRDQWNARIPLPRHAAFAE